MFKTENQMYAKDIHCPFCNENHAILLNKEKSKSWSFQLPAYGLKYLLTLIYLPGAPFIKGFKTGEIVKKDISDTYCFCPLCGNSFSLNPPEEIAVDNSEPKFYRIKKDKAMFGICTGIAEYTDLPLLWVRIVTAFYCLLVLPLIAYLVLGGILPCKEDVIGDYNGTEK